jgi:hypothetical protein
MFDVPMSPVLLGHSRVIADFSPGVGHYGVDKFVNKRMYQEVRDESGRLCPQRPYNVEDPSPWVKESHGGADARGQVKALKEMCPSEIVGTLLHLDTAILGRENALGTDNTMEALSRRGLPRSGCNCLILRPDVERSHPILPIYDIIAGEGL